MGASGASPRSPNAPNALSVSPSSLPLQPQKGPQVAQDSRVQVGQSKRPQAPARGAMYLGQALLLGADTDEDGDQV